MTTTEDSVSFSPAVRRQPVGLCLVVGAAVTVGWVLYRHYWLNDVVARIARWEPVANHFWMYALILALCLCVPYALVLLLWGRGLAQGTSGAVVALVAGLVFWAIDWVFVEHVWASGDQSVTSLGVYEWSQLLTMAFLVPLAWGLARRSGRAWMLGLVVGPVVAAILHELELHWSWWIAHVVFAQRGHWELQAVVFVAPFVLAVLACWGIEAHRRTPEIGSSA